MKIKLVGIGIGLAAIAIIALFILQSGEGPANAQSNESLVIYSGRSESLVAPIIELFSESSNISVSVKYGGTPELAATLLEEGDATPADLFFAQDPSGLGAVEEMFSSLPSSITTLVPAWSQSGDNKWVGISGRARTVVYNTENLNESDLPDDIFDFIDPKWNGRIGWAPTNGSFQTMVASMRILWGDEKTINWLEGIQNNNPTIFSSNTPQVAATGSGEIDIGFVNHYYLFRFLAEEGEDFAARNYHTRAGGPGALIMVSGAGILASSDNQSAAEQFITFMLSQESQTYFANETFEYPLIDRVPINNLLVPLDAINRPEINLSDLKDVAGTQNLLREAGVLP